MKESMKVFAVLLFLSIVKGENYLAHNPTLDAYSDTFTRGAKNPGFWGVVPPNRANVFDDKWNTQGYQQMYNLNSQSPMAGARATGFDTTTTMFNQYGPTGFEVIPVQSNFKAQKDINAYAYDVNEPRMQAIYKNYMRMMNKNLERLSNVIKGNTEFSDLNNNELRKLKNPSSFEYRRQYFDGMDDAHTIPAYYTKKMTPIPQPSQITNSERRLTQDEKRSKNLKTIEKLKLNLEKLKSKLNFLEEMEVEEQKKEALQVQV